MHHYDCLLYIYFQRIAYGKEYVSFCFIATCMDYLYMHTHIHTVHMLLTSSAQDSSC